MCMASTAVTVLRGMAFGVDKRIASRRLALVALALRRIISCVSFFKLSTNRCCLWPFQRL